MCRQIIFFLLISLTPVARLSSAEGHAKAVKKAKKTAARLTHPELEAFTVEGFSFPGGKFENGAWEQGSPGKGCRLALFRNEEGLTVLKASYPGGGKMFEASIGTGPPSFTAWYADGKKMSKGTFTEGNEGGGTRTVKAWWPNGKLALDETLGPEECMDKLGFFDEKGAKFYHDETSAYFRGGCDTDCGFEDSWDSGSAGGGSGSVEMWMPEIGQEQFGLKVAKRILAQGAYAGHLRTGRWVFRGAVADGNFLEAGYAEGILEGPAHGAGFAGAYAGGKRSGDWKETRYGRAEGGSDIHEETGRYESGKREGPWVTSASWVEYGKEYANNSTVLANYRLGKLHGTWKKYEGQSDSAGIVDTGLQVLVEEGEYADGVKSGIWKSHPYGGSGSSLGLYRDDAMNGPWTFWDSAGNTTGHGSFAGGEKDGHWREASDGGRDLLEGDYRGGKRVGEWKEWVNGELSSIGRIQPPLTEMTWTSLAVTHTAKVGAKLEKGQAPMWRENPFGIHPVQFAFYPSDWKPGETDRIALQYRGLTVPANMMKWDRSGYEPMTFSAGALRCERLFLMPWSGTFMASGNSEAWMPKLVPQAGHVIHIFNPHALKFVSYNYGGNLVAQGNESQAPEFDEDRWASACAVKGEYDYYLKNGRRFMFKMPVSGSAYSEFGGKILTIDASGNTNERVFVPGPVESDMGDFKGGEYPDEGESTFLPGHVGVTSYWPAHCCRSYRLPKGWVDEDCNVIAPVPEPEGLGIYRYIMP